MAHKSACHSLFLGGLSPAHENAQALSIQCGEVRHRVAVDGPNPRHRTIARKGPKQLRVADMK